MRHINTSQKHFKKNPLLLFTIAYAIVLIPISFLFKGMITGLLSLIFVVTSSITYSKKGGLFSAMWASFVLVLSYILFHTAMPVLSVAGGIIVYFFTGLVVGVHVELLYGKNREINIKNTALLQEKKRLETLFKSSFEAIVFLDKNHLVLDVNQHFIQLFGYSLEEITGMDLDDVMDKGKDSTSDRELTQKLILQGEQIQLESTRYNKSGLPIEVAIRAVPIIIDGEIIGGYALYDDITNRKYYEEQLKYLGFHDQLTGLYNRLYFENTINELSDGNEYPISIITLDLNGLKLINDTMGHLTGDELLQVSAEILKTSVPDPGKAFRIGGDEFAVLLPLTEDWACERIVCKIRTAIKIYNEDHQMATISLSIGTASAKSNDISLKEVFRRADDLMYREKLYEGASVRAQLISALMATLAERDHITEGHAKRLDDLCIRMGRKAGLPSHRLANLTLLSQVHDLGKVGIPDNILRKPGPLTESEWETMKLHPEKGYRIALSSPDLSGVADLILKHHEKWDGTGYPLGIIGKEIPLECRILNIIDSFDAMTNDRPYSKGRSKEDALEEIKRCSGTQFDPELVMMFLEIALSDMN